MTTVLYEIGPNDPLVYGLAIGILILTTIAAISGRRDERQPSIR